tara:strand:+ start:48 stop:887 length:840 start_codon:yes stop_codon:yes gene_type:complete
MNKLIANSYSHATMDVIKEGSSNYVIKTFDHDLDRVNKNISKQKQFINKTFGNISLFSVPIIDITKHSKKITIKMPYIDGLSGSDIILYSHRTNFISFLKFVENYFLECFKKVDYQNIDSHIFLKKVDDIFSNTSIKISISENIIKKGINKIKNMTIPIGTCHGDFTLDNMIIGDDGRFYLIDFLKTYLDTPLQDFIKLKQDTEYGWCVRKLSKSDQTKANVFFDKIKELPILKKIEMEYTKEIKILNLISLLRIAPYVKDKITENWLEYHLNKITKHL